jgi:predicted exporter
LQADLDRAQAGLPFKPGLFAPFLDAIEAARTGPLLAPQDLVDTPLGLRLGGLLFQNDSGWTALLPLTGIADAKRLTELIASLGDPDIRYIDLRGETNRLGVEFRDTALLRLGGGTVLLFLVLWVGLKSPARALTVLLPVALAGEADLLVLSLLGEHLSLFHLISLILVVGISIDYNLFFSRVFLSRADPDVADRRRTLRALGLCCATTVAGFGPLSFSSLPVLEAIGSTVAIGVIAGLLFAIALSRPVLPPVPQGPKTRGQASGFPDRAPSAHVLDTR